LAWHPHEQDEQSQVPQHPVLAIFCALDVFISAMVKLLCGDNTSLRCHKG